MGRETVVSRRALLRIVGGSVVGLSTGGCMGMSSDPEGSDPTQTQTPTRTSTDTPTSTEEPTETPEEWDIDPVEHDKLVGAHYYPWYFGEDGWAAEGDAEGTVHGGWTNYTPGTPMLGEYNSSNQDVINQHLKWAIEHGINWFISGGPQDPSSRVNRILRDNVMGSDLADHLSFSILAGFPTYYEQDEQNLFDLDLRENRETLEDEMQYFSDTYFGDDNYLRVDNRPVLYYYGADLAAGDIEGAFKEAISQIPENPYLIADPNFWKPPADAEHLMEAFDAVLEYNMYTPDEEIIEDFTEEVIGRYELWKLASQDYEVDFIPMTLPGYNDSKLRQGNPVLEHDSERFRDLSDKALDYIDTDLQAIVITSFNEWPEYTAIEPSEENGMSHLNAVEEVLARGTPDNNDLSEYVPLEIVFNDTTEKSEKLHSDVSDDVALQLWRLQVYEGDENLFDYNLGGGEEPLFGEGVYEPAIYNDDPETSARNLGGRYNTARLYLPPDAKESTDATLWGKPWVDGLEADIHFDGRKTDHVELPGENPGELREYQISLS